MTEIEKLKHALEKIQEAKSNAVTKQLFEVSAKIREQEKILLEQIVALTFEAERVIKYAAPHLKNTN
jgi:hypothetical protein